MSVCAVSVEQVTQLRMIVVSSFIPIAFCYVSLGDDVEGNNSLVLTALKEAVVDMTAEELINALETHSPN